MSISPKMCKAAACSANLHQNPFLGGMQAAPRHRVTDVMPGFAVQLSQSSSHGFSLNFSPRGEAWLPALKCLRDQHPAVDTPRVLLVGGGGLCSCLHPGGCRQTVAIHPPQWCLLMAHAVWSPFKAKKQALNPRLLQEDNAESSYSPAHDSLLSRVNTLPRDIPDYPQGNLPG